MNKKPTVLENKIQKGEGVKSDTETKSKNMQ